jgi:hypothetical protein
LSKVRQLRATESGFRHTVPEEQAPCFDSTIKGTRRHDGMFRPQKTSTSKRRVVYAKNPLARIFNLAKGER